ncbi:MAG: DUF4365 domain-containing protein [Actinobacteria bacterium]|nr:DUF4365 domain-containing protein [Actinomycetota bacterium]
MTSIQQPSAVQLGEFGEDQAVAFFSGIGWGPLKTGKHDLGTDLFVQLRTDDLIDLRMLLGAQVKTGPSFFNEPGTVDGREGWWFRESSKKHAEYWLNHHVPHILVLQTTDMATRVWTVLDSRTIENTGVGIKVFVPAAQVLDSSWKPRWIDLVTEARKLLSFEGSRWTFSITQLPQDVWARYALLVPSLVAPHPNRGFSSPINWAEAIAICASGTPDRWDMFASQHTDVPSEPEALLHAEPGWRLAGVIRRWVMGGTATLEGVQTTSLPRHLEVARVICAAVAATDRYDLDQAAAILGAQLVDGGLSVDQVWISVHLAHVRRLQGDLDGARKLLEEGLVASAALSADITTSALRSACVLGLFDLAPIHSADIGSAVTAADNSAAWWRTQIVASGLESDAKKRFKKWARDRSIVFGGAASAHNDLFSAALTARLAGSFGAWRSYASLLAQIDLVTPPDGDADVAISLDSLRQSGDTKTLKLAIQKVRADGPMKAIADLAEIATPDHATSMSIYADLELLAEAGEHFDADHARPWLDALLTGLTQPEAFYKRYAIRQWALHEIVEALVGLARHFTRQDQIRILEFAQPLASDASQLLQGPLSRLLHQLDPTLIDEYLAAYDTDSAPTSWPGELFRDLLAPRSARVRMVVRKALLKGDLMALSGANDITRIESDEASVLLDHCESAFERNKLPSNGIAMRGLDEYRLTTIIALNGPASTRARAWSVITDAIAEPIDVPERKYAAVKIIAGHPDQVPRDHREQLIAAARAFGNAPPSRYASPEFGLKPTGPAFTELLLELEGKAPEWNGLLATLLAGDTQARCGACDILARRPGHEVTLLALTHDADQGVATRAARGIAQRIASDEGLAPAYAAQLQELSVQGGESMPYAALSGISTSETLTEGAEWLLASLLDHASPAVRQKTAELISSRRWQVGGGVASRTKGATE